MPHTFTLTLTNNLDALPRHIEAASNYLKEAGANQHDAHCTELIIEELVTNTIKYGYSDTALHEICIKLNITPKAILIEIIDNAAPFDPTKTSDPSTAEDTSPLEERQPGGLGLLLVKKLSQAFTYERIGSTNKQTLTLKRT